MVAIDADDPIVSELLTSTLGLVLEAGGTVAADLTLVARTGQLHLESAIEGTLVTVPREAFVRVDRFAYEEHADRIVITDHEEGIDERELELAYTSVALANACEKLNWMKRTHPALAGDVSSTVVDAVRAIIPSYRSETLDPIDVYWANRCFKIDLGDGPERVLIPIVDLLNHHANGAVGDWADHAFSVRAARPFDTGPFATNECALDYGMDRDALTFAVVYGFVPMTTPNTDVSPARLQRIIDAQGEESSPAVLTLVAAAKLQLSTHQ